MISLLHITELCYNVIKGRNRDIEYFQDDVAATSRRRLKSIDPVVSFQILLAPLHLRLRFFRILPSLSSLHEQTEKRKKPIK